MQFLEIEFMSPEYDEAVRLRDLVLRKPLHLEFLQWQLEEEYDETHIAVFDEGLILIGSLSLKPISQKVLKMRQVAIQEDKRGSGVGKALVGISETWAKQHGFEKIELHARDLAVAFYKKLGYTISGNGFTEVGILHFKMFKKIR